MAAGAVALAVGGCAGSSSPPSGGNPAGSAGVPAAGSTASSPSGGSTPSSRSGASTSGQGFNTSLDPCALLTADQVAKAIGLKVSHGSPVANTDTKACGWDTKFGQGADYSCATDVTSVVLELVTPPAALKKLYPTARSYFAVELTTYKRRPGSVAPLSGIGDQAFAWTIATNKGLDTLALKGNVILRVFSNCGRPATLRPELEQLLSQALTQT